MKTPPLFRINSGQLLTCGAVCVQLTAHGADVFKADNNNNLNLASSWEFATLPTDVDIACWDNLVFSANSTLLGANQAWDGIRVFDPAGPVTIGGSHTLTLGASGVDLFSATQNLTLNTAVALAADQTWSNTTGRTLTVSGPISGAFNLTKTGAGPLVLDGSVSNSFGNLTIDTSGGAQATSTIFLGKTGGAVAVAADKAVQFGTGNTGAMNLRMLQPNQFGSNVTLNFGNASGQWGRFDLNGKNQTLAGLNAGLLATQGGAVVQNRLVGDSSSQLGPVTLTLNGTGEYLYNGYLRDVDGGTVGNNVLSLIKNGSGTQTLAGSQIIYTGGTTINDGKLLLGGGAAVGVLRGALTINSPGTLDYLANDGFGYGAGTSVNSLTLNGATLGGSNFSNHFFNSFALNMTGASILLGGTNNEFHNSTITVNPSTTTSTIARVSGNTTALMRIRDGQPITFNVADGSQPVDLLVSAPLTTPTAGSIATKTGPGTLSLSGAQDNASTVLAVTGGTVLLDKSAAGVRAAAGISNIGTGATVKLIGTGGDQIYGGAATGNNGRVNMSGGTLDLGGLNEGVDRIEGTGTITNSTAATTSVLTVGETNGSALFSGSINDGAGAVKLVKSGTGTLGLSGSSNLSGSVEVNAGTLALSGSLASATKVADGAGISGEGSVPTLTLGAVAGGSLTANPATAGALSVSGALEVKGTTTVNVAGTFTSGVPFKVVNFGSKAGIWNASNFALANPANFRGTPTFVENAGDISLTLSGANLTWNNAAADLKWNSNLSANFHDGAANSTFFWGDGVTFGDGPGANQQIVIEGPQNPASMTVNSQYDYTFTGASGGLLGGGMSLLKSGTGTLALGTNNTFLGSTTVNGGTLLITSDASLGTAPITATPGHLAINGGTLRWNANFNINGNRGIALGAGGATFNTAAAGNGNNVNISSAIVGNGGVTIQANGDTSDTGGGVGGYTQLTGVGNSFTGPIAITGGMVGMQSNLGDAANTVLLNGGGLLDPNLNITFPRNIQIGALGGIYRSFGSVATGTLSGSISNAPGVLTTTLKHTDGGTVWIAGDTSGFAGEYQNKRGITRFSAPSANLSKVDFVQDTGGGAVEFRGGGVATVKSIAATRDVLVNFGTRLNVGSGALSMSTNGHWMKSDNGTLGEVTSSSGMLTVTNGALTGALATLDHQINNVRIVDFNGSTPLTFVKTGVNQLQLAQANTYTGGTIVHLGRLHPNNLQSLGTGPVTVNNGGQVMLPTAGTYTNNFTIAGPGQNEAAGTLGAIRFVSNTLAGSITVAPAGSRITAHGGFGIHTGALLGSGALEVNSTASGNNGTVSLNGNNSGYTGVATIAQGRLNVASTPFGGGLSVPDGTTLAGEPTAATVTLGSASGSNLIIDASTPAMLSTTGAMTVNGTITVNPIGVVPSGAAPIKVVGFASKGGLWNEANFALSGAANYRPGAAFAEVASTIELTIPSIDLVWNNALANSTWSTNVDANFQDSVPTNQVFFWGDRVSFGDLPESSQAITIAGSVQPSVMTVNSQYDYSFGGGAIGGGMVVKSGTGILTLGQANTLSGALVKQGELRIGNVTGVGTGPVTLNDATTGANPTAFIAAAAVNGVANNVTVANQGTGPVTLGSVLGQSGLVVYSGAFQIDRPVTINGSTDRTTFTGKISGNVGTIRIAGNAGNRTTIANAANNFVGDVVISDGVIYQNDHANALPVTTSVTGEGTAQFRINNGGIHTIDTLEGTGATNIVAGGATTLSLGNGNGTGTYAGVISDSSAVLSIAKAGTGTQEFTGSNTYTGTTTVNGGTLLANNTTGSGTGTGAVTVNATGKLSGNGAIGGAVTVASGGTLAPGASIESLATGGLTLASGGSLAVEFNSSGVPTADVLNVTGNVSLAGNLNLTDLAGVPATIPLGTKLTIMTYTGTLTGSFAGVPEGTTVTSGTNTFLVRYADGNAVTLETSNVVANPYDTWAASKGLTAGNKGAELDPDMDGLNNLLEFYLNGNPLGQDGSIRPVVATDATYLILTFTRRDDAEAHASTELIQRGSSLNGWTDIVLGAVTSGPDANGVIVEVTENNGSPDTIKVSIPRALAVSGKLFARLRVAE